MKDNRLAGGTRALDRIDRLGEGIMHEAVLRRTALAVALVTGCLLAPPAAAEPISFNSAFSYRRNEGPNTIGFARWPMYRLALALLLAATFRLVHGGVDPAAEALEGTWLVRVTDQPRERFLIVSGARSEGNRVHVATALFGRIDGRGGEVGGWNAEVSGDTIQLTFVTPGQSVVNVEFKADESSVSGTFTTKDGKNYDVRMTRLPAEEMAALRAAAAAAASKKDTADRKALADRTAIVPGVAVIAQDSLIGTWQGSFPFFRKGSTENMAVELNIVSVENGVVKGTATLLSHTVRCAGEYPMAGRLKENKLSMRATSDGGKEGCSFALIVVHEGNTLSGTTGGGWSLKLSK